MSSSTMESTITGSPHPVAVAIRRRRARIIFFLSAVVVLGVGLALSADTLGGQSKENVRFFLALGWVGAGICGLFCIPLTIFTNYKRARAVDELANNPNALARWTYTAEEQAAFVARERERRRLTRKDLVVLACIVAGVGVVVAGLGKVFYGWGPHMILGVVICTVCGAAILVVLMIISNRHTLKTLPETFAGEVIIGPNGLLTVKQMKQWGTREAQLIGAEFAPGEPGELQFKVRTTVQTQEGTSQSVEDLRVPVPKGHEEEARRLVAALLGGG